MEIISLTIKDFLIALVCLLVGFSVGKEIEFRNGIKRYKSLEKWCIDKIENKK